MTEDQLQDAIIDAATVQGWLVYHTYDSRRSAGGFPDLVLVRGRRVVFAELKSAKGTLSREQQVWIDRLGDVDEPSAHVWRPQEWIDGTIDRVLQRTERR